MNDCKVCIHYDCCCGWTSKEVIDSLDEAIEDGDCRECNYYEPKKIGKWVFKKYVGEDYYRCSCCGQEYPFPPNWCEYDIHEYLKYCSACGARMTEE